MGDVDDQLHTLIETLRRANEDLRAAQDQLVRVSTLRAVGDLASGMAHHINNLLGVILGRIQLVLEKVEDPALRRSLEIAEQAACDVAEVVRRVREFSQAQRVSSVVPVDLNHLAREALELARPRWKDEVQLRGIQIEAVLEAGEIPAAAGEVGPVREVLVSLLLNAVEALPGGGRIAIRTWASERGVHCAVADTGVGMSEEVRRRAVEPFFTTKGPRSTGLGMSLAYGVIQRYGSELTIQGAEGQGTTVALTLPIAPEAPAAEPPVVTWEPGSLAILVIEAEPALRETIVEMLRSQGHTAVQASDGKAGLARLEGGGTVDLVLTDLGMPGMTGWDVARAVKAQWPRLPVGLITGWGQEPAGGPDDRAAVDFVLSKPLSFEALREAIARVRPKPPMT